MIRGQRMAKKMGTAQASIMKGALQETLLQLDPERIFLISRGEARDVTARFPSLAKIRFR